jgi:hypothetical protein
MPFGSTANPIGHWYKLIEGLHTSPSELYTSVERVLLSWKISDANSSRVDWKEAGTFSANREYLRMSRGKYVVDICGAPYGNGFFVSWWLAETTPSPIGPSIVTLAVILLLFYSLGILGGIVALVFGFIAVGGIISSSPEEEWVSYPLVVPFFGPLWERLFAPATYYRIDTALMFKAVVHESVLKVIDGMTEAKGLRALSESDRKPILKDFFQR